jgi:hypothetical protein
MEAFFPATRAFFTARGFARAGAFRFAGAFAVFFTAFRAAGFAGFFLGFFEEVFFPAFAMLMKRTPSDINLIRPGARGRAA